jgi:aminopeptidase N
MDLVAAGRRTDGGKEGGLRWERRVTERPTFGVSFEVGSFKEYHARAGDMALTLYVDYFSSSVVNPWRDELLEAVAGSLENYGEVFGEYPFDELTVVTAPRGFSQSLLGFVTLSSAMVGDLGSLSFFLEDRRTVVAHEVAHQWWGYVVGWKGYRDQWISEAMANYSALLYARNRLEERPWRGPTTGWCTALTRTTADGRPLESIGPVVLGARLISSHAEGAYEAIVYQKGAVVLDMIARIFGEETFLKVLGAIARAVDFRSVSTEDFVALIEKASGAELAPFAAQRRGDPRAAYNLLRKKLLRDAVDDVEGVTVLAIAAAAIGEREAMEEAADAGVNLALLEER